MKKIISYCFIPGLCIMSFVLYCTSGDKSKTETDVPIKGWFDDNTYRISGDGRPLAILTDFNERKKSSRNAAIMRAKFKLRQKLTSANMKLKPAYIYNLIDNKGKPIYERFDAEGGCEIIFEIKEDGLKQLFPGVD